MLSSSAPVLLDVIRSPFGKYHGGLSALRADDLLAQLLVALQVRNSWLNSSPVLRVEQVLVGCANQAGEDSRNIARLSCLLAGFPVETVAVTLNQLCGSSAMALQQGVALIRATMADVVIIGGVENMSRSPLVALPQPYGDEQAAISSVFGWRFSNPRFKQAVVEGSYFKSMAETAEGLAQRFGITRHLQEVLTVASHQKAINANKDGIQQGIISIERLGDTLFLQDECPRAGLNQAVLARLPLLNCQQAQASLTAGTCSPFADGAGVALLVSQKLANNLKLEGVHSPLGLLLSDVVSVGVSPTEMGFGGAIAIQQLMKQSALSGRDVTCWELHEPFAVSHFLACQALGLDWQASTVNGWGGSLAIGSPMGTIGLRVLCSLAWRLHNQAKSSAPIGVGGLSVGMGQGVAFSIQKNGY